VPVASRALGPTRARSSLRAGRWLHSINPEEACAKLEAAHAELIAPQHGDDAAAADGLFLVRPSTSEPSCLTISYRSRRGDIVHQRIVVVAGRCYLGAAAFDSLDDLVEYYCKYELYPGVRLRRALLPSGAVVPVCSLGDEPGCVWLAGASVVLERREGGPAGFSLRWPPDVSVEFIAGSEDAAARWACELERASATTQDGAPGCTLTCSPQMDACHVSPALHPALGRVATLARWVSPPAKRSSPWRRPGLRARGAARD
jgi:hypothetical protein